MDKTNNAAARALMPVLTRDLGLPRPRLKGELATGRPLYLTHRRRIYSVSLQTILSCPYVPSNDYTDEEVVNATGAQPLPGSLEGGEHIVHRLDEMEVASMFAACDETLTGILRGAVLGGMRTDTDKGYLVGDSGTVAGVTLQLMRDTVKALDEAGLPSDLKAYTTPRGKETGATLVFVRIGAARLQFIPLPMTREEVEANGIVKVVAAQQTLL